MAQYNFEGDINNITERQLEFIKDIINENGYENCKVTFEPVGKAGDNYMASVKRISVEGENGTLKLIAKIAPSLDVVRGMMNTSIAFINEHIMYTELLPKLVQLQNEANVPEEEKLLYAKCYGSLAEEPNEVILLEDLNTLDYTMLNRFEPLPVDCVKSMLKNFAIYHSLSYALKYKEPETYNHFKANLIDYWSKLENLEHMKILFESIERDTLSALGDSDQKDIIKNLKIKNTLQISRKLAKADSDTKYSVIIQGDAWTNNIMFKFKEGTLASSIMIDYQISKNGNPIMDLMYFIFNCTDYETRKEHFYDWIDYYHSELDKSLSNFNLKANYVYPRDKLDADLKRYGKLLFGLTILLSTVLVLKSDDAEKAMDQVKTGNPNPDEMSMNDLDEDTRNLFKGRIIALINSFTEFGLI